MKIIDFFSDGRLYLFRRIIIENVKKRALGLFINFDANEWGICISFGYIFGKIYISFNHKFLFRNLKKIFFGKNFGEVGREIGFMIQSDYSYYSLFWWSDPNRPEHKWRTRIIQCK